MFQIEFISTMKIILLIRKKTTYFKFSFFMLTSYDIGYIKIGQSYLVKYLIKKFVC
jgi:hypothetical protein